MGIIFVLVFECDLIGLHERALVLSVFIVGCNFDCSWSRVLEHMGEAEMGFLLLMEVSFEVGSPVDGNHDVKGTIFSS